MGKVIFAAAVFLLSLTGILGDVIVRGSLHDAMLVGLKTHPSMRKVTVDNPYHSISSGRRKPSVCTWEMRAFIVGAYAVDKTMMIMDQAECSQYTAAQWSDVLPCVFTRDDMTTRCKGPLPETANNIKWTIGYAVVHPYNMKLPRKPAAVPRNLTSVPFVAEPNLVSMIGLGVAKTIHVYGQYSGSGVITMYGYRRPTFIFTSKKVNFWLETTLSMPTTYNNVNVSWTAWLEGNNLVVDMHASWLNETRKFPVIDDPLLRDRRKRSLSSPVSAVASSASALALNAALRTVASLRTRLSAAIGTLTRHGTDPFVEKDTITETPQSTSVAPTQTTGTAEPVAHTPAIITSNTVVSYTRNDLQSSRITVNGKSYRLIYNPSFRIISVEPRLCPDLSLSTACGIMRDIDSDEAERLRIGGNVTSFYLRDLTRCRRGGENYVCAKGNVVGTTGLLVDVKYKSVVLDSADPVWTELPIESFSRCAQSVYFMSECKPMQELRSFSGQHHSEKRGVLYNF